MIWVDMKKIVAQLKSEGFSEKIELVGYYKDAVGRKHKSKPYKINLEAWGC